MKLGGSLPSSYAGALSLWPVWACICVPLSLPADQTPHSFPAGNDTSQSRKQDSLLAGMKASLERRSGGALRHEAGSTHGADALIQEVSEIIANRHCAWEQCPCTSPVRISMQY